VIRLPWRKPAPDPRLAEAEQALHEAVTRKADALARYDRTRALGDEIRELRRRNGFGEAVWTAMGGTK